MADLPSNIVHLSTQRAMKERDPDLTILVEGWAEEDATLLLVTADKEGQEHLEMVLHEVLERYGSAPTWKDT